MWQLHGKVRKLQLKYVLMLLDKEIWGKDIKQQTIINLIIQFEIIKLNMQYIFFFYAKWLIHLGYSISNSAYLKLIVWYSKSKFLYLMY